LLVSCPDRPGIVAAMSTFLRDEGANIVEADQHSTDPEGGMFFMRAEFALDVGQEERDELAKRFDAQVAAPFEMGWRFSLATDHKRLAVLVSREDHCLLDLLWRVRRGDVEARIDLVISNHTDLADDVASFGVPYHHVPVPRDGKAEAEERALALLAGNCDLVVLARYMQILSGEFLERLGTPVINIHHSFLPAFAGAAPYRQAKERGVKLIGATAHYATEELDAGPIIAQDVIRVSHRDGVAQLARRGADVERTVLARAVQAHCEDRVIVHGGTTVVF
ncbi:MAG: formyltetrahydrofolate deformylase, partial [Solirubrobacterales bacterium]